MKDQVPVVLLNHWLEVEPEKSGFAKPKNCIMNSEEMSVYSDETMTNLDIINIKGLLLKDPFKSK
jgi:hypothetical protein